MTVSGSKLWPLATQLGTLRAGLTDLTRLATLRLHNPVFWQIQAMVGVITILHYVPDWLLNGTPYEQLHSIPVVIYVFPIIYASLRFQREGGLLTGLWCAIISIPSMVLEHRHSLEWLTEAVPILTSVAVGIVLSALVEHEAEARRKAEDMAAWIALLNRQLTGLQEEEWRRIARELHDDIAQSVVLLCQRFDRLSAAPRLPGTARAQLAEMRSMAQATLADVRRFARDLRPSVLDDLGFIAAIRWLVGDLKQNHGLGAGLIEASPLPRLQPAVELGLFRIVQEALRNVVRHSKATEVSITMSCVAGELSITIQDNGVGFTPPATFNDLVSEAKLGIVGMQERIQLLNGSLAIASKPGQGTTLSVRVPCVSP